MGHAYIFATIILTVYGQLVLKWPVEQAGELPGELAAKAFFLFKLFGNLCIVSAFVAAFMASLTWMAAMTKFELSYAYPFMSLAFVIVMIFSITFLGEGLTWTKGCGTLMVVVGLLVLTR